MTTGQDSDDSIEMPTMQQFRNVTSSRRRLLAGAGAVAGAGALGLTGSTLAQEDEEEPPEVEVPEAYQQPNTDADVLRYALTLERLESAFYATGAETFSAEELQNAEALADYGEAVTATVPEFVATIGEHEAAHVTQIERVLEVLGAEVDEAPEFTFGFETADEFLATAQVLENTGVSAYAGAAPSIESPDILSAALSIHSVEARHAAYLDGLLGETPFANAFDPALSMQEVVGAIQPFLPEEMPGETPGAPNGTETETPGAPNGTETSTETGTNTGTDGGT